MCISIQILSCKINLQLNLWSWLHGVSMNRNYYGCKKFDNLLNLLDKFWWPFGIKGNWLWQFIINIKGLCHKVFIITSVSWWFIGKNVSILLLKLPIKYLNNTVVSSCMDC